MGLVDFDKNFFIIDSNNVDKICTKLYGYAISQNHILTDDDLTDNISLDGTGAYVYISVVDDKINIYQDINGCFGIYVYANDQYFAISNSFVKLVNHIKGDFELSLNHDYSASLLTSDVCSFVVDETLVNEITILPRNYIINIDKNKKEINYEIIDYEENTLSLNSFEGIRTLDEWFYKWESILKNIYAKTDNISFDLSGGMDSRGIIPILLNSGIDYQHFNINSRVADEPNFVIAKQIADDYGIELNKDLNVEYTYLEDLDSYFEPSFLTKLGSIKLLFPSSRIPTDPIYSFTGFGGACIRGHPIVSPKRHIRFIYQSARKYSQEYGDLLKKKDEENFDKLDKRFAPENYDELPAYAHKEVRARYIHGKSMVEKFCGNYIYLAPYFDPLIYKIKVNDEDCEDKNLLITMIYSRYCPQLLNYPFDGDRKIDEGTIEYAKHLNMKYPLMKNEKSEESVQKQPIKQDMQHSQNASKKNNIPYKKTQKYLHDIFTTQSFKNTFKKYFSESIYRKALADLEDESGQIVSIRDVFSVIFVVKTIMDIEYSRNTNDSFGFLSKFLDNKPYSEYGSELMVGKLSLKIPEGFWINSDKSITNEKITINFRVYDDKLSMAHYDKIIERYINDIQSENVEPQQDLFNVNNIPVQKIKNPKTNATRYWFKRNNSIYQMYTFSRYDYIDAIIKKIINSIQDDIIIIGNLMFKLPPNYYIDSSESITDGKTTYFFTFEKSDNENGLKSKIKSYKNYIKHKNDKIQENSFNLNNIQAHVVKNTESSTTRCWFEKDNIIYQIFTYSKFDDVDEIVKFLIKNLE